MKDEAPNVSRALSSVPKSCGILAIDAQSKDRSVPIAREFGADIIVRPWEGFVATRRFAIGCVDTPWTFMLDADEALDSELGRAIETLQPRSDVDGYAVRRATFFCGRAMRHGAWGADMPLRFFRTDRAQLVANPVAGGVADLHERWTVPGRTETVAGSLLHYSYPTIKAYGAKFQRYTTLEARGLRGSAFSLAREALLALLRVPNALFLRSGWRDGWRGAYVAIGFRGIPRDRGVESASIVNPDVALDLPRARQLSVGMKAYAEALAERLPRVAPDLSFEVVTRTTALDLSEQFATARALRRLRPRLTHHLSFYAPLFGPHPYVITVHDLIHLRFPAYFKKTVGPYYATVVRAVCARAARVITDDERTIADLERFLGVPKRKIVVIELGIDDLFFAEPAPAAMPRPYFFYAGNHREHKDLATLFAAWESLDPSTDVDLVLTGHDDLDVTAPRPQRERGSLQFAGDVDASRLASLYAGSVALVHPALREGFGLPMVEAAATGAAVIACEDAVPGVLRPHVDTFPARDVRALAALMTRALLVPGPHADARGIARSLTWDRCAERTAEVYRAVLNERRSK